VSQPLGAGERLHRLLAVLAYLSTTKEASIGELATRFEMSEATLVAELELAACCGLPPYTPDQLLELVVDGDTVHAYGLEPLTRPRRLTPEEGFAVAAAARALLAVPGSAPDGPLGRALGKLEAVLGEDRLQVDVQVSRHALVLRQAVGDQEVVELDYLGAFRGGETTRAVEPHAVITREGRLYLDAYCRVARDWRRFQLERISAVRPLQEHFEVRPAPEALTTSPGAFVGGEDSVVVRITLADEASALVERFAAGAIERDGKGRAVVPVAVSDRRFLGRLLLRLGPDATVVEPAHLERARSEVAQAALERYRRPPACPETDRADACSGEEAGGRD